MPSRLAASTPPPQATAAHGITNADVAGAQMWRRAARDWRRFPEGCDLHGYGIRSFEFPLLRWGFGRVAGGVGGGGLAAGRARGRAGGPGFVPTLPIIPAHLTARFLCMPERAQACGHPPPSPMPVLLAAPAMRHTATTAATAAAALEPIHPHLPDLPRRFQCTQERVQACGHPSVPPDACPAGSTCSTTAAATSTTARRPATATTAAAASATDIIIVAAPAGAAAVTAAG